MILLWIKERQSKAWNHRETITKRRTETERQGEETMLPWKFVAVHVGMKWMSEHVWV